MEDAAAGEHGRVHAEPGRAEADAADRLEERADAAPLAGPTPAIQQKYAYLNARARRRLRDHGLGL